MRKILIISFLIVAMLITTVPVCAAEDIEVGLLGDLNQDGYVSIIDARTTLRIAAGIEAADANSYAFGDIDLNANIDIGDAIYILRLSAGLETATNIYFSESRVISPSTCTTHGIKAYTDPDTCRTKYVELPLASHSKVPATCMDGAYCSMCFAYLSDPIPHNIVNGICQFCYQNFSGASIIYLGSKEISFGANSTDLIKTFGTPTETLQDVSKGRKLTYFVYAQDYTKLTVFTYSDTDGIIGVYSIDPLLTIKTANNVINFNNVTDRYKVDDVYFDEYIDKIGTQQVYAFYATTVRDTMTMHPDSIFLTNEKIVFHLTNGLRAINNVPSVSYSEELSNVALQHSTDMAYNNFFSHVSSNGLTLPERLINNNVKYLGCGENIAAASKMSPYDFIDAWYNSSGHRKIVLKANYSKLGVGIAYNANSDYKFYGTQDYTLDEL